MNQILRSDGFDDLSAVANIPKIGAAYVRVSTDMQEEYSPASQLKAIRDYASKEGYIIPDEYCYQDDAIRGKWAEKRPDFMRMIATAKEKNKPFDSIFVWKFSRFARNQEESVVYKSLLRKNGVAVKSVTEPSADDNPFNGLVESVISWMDEYYCINLATEVRRGMNEKASRGEAIGRAPYGYANKDKIYVIDNQEAEIIRYIFQSFANGVGARRIAATLAERGIKTRRGKDPDNRWVHYILTNPVYIGKIRYSSNGHANYDRPYYNGENVTVFEGKHEAIIPQDLWDAVQEKIKKRDTEPKYVRKPADVFMLKGLVRCGNCGATLCKCADKWHSLQCHKYARGQCSVSHSIAMDKANEAVIAALESIIQNDAYTFAPPKETPAEPNSNLEKLIASEQARMERAKYAMLDGALSTKEYKDVKKEIDANIDKLKSQIKSDADKRKSNAETKAYKKKLVHVLDIIKAPDTPPDAKNQALRSIIDKIVFHRPENTFDIFLLP